MHIFPALTVNLTAMTQNAQGQVVRSVKQVELGERLSIRLSHGELSATVMNKEETQ